jgi:hypothetical protein
MDIDKDWEINNKSNVDNKKFWGELTTYFPLTTYWVFDTSQTA